MKRSDDTVIWSIIQTMIDLPLNALRALAMVHAHGGVRAAARVLGVAHSSVSRHLTELAAWLGTPVLREGGTALTPQGERLAIATLAGLGEMERAVASIRERRSPFTVTIATSPSFASRWLLPRLPRLEAAFPRIQLSLLVDQRLDDLDRGDIDLALRMGRGPWPGLVCEALMDDVVFPVMSRAYAEEHGMPAVSAELAGLRLLHDRDPQTGWQRWRETFGPAELEVDAGPRFASSDLVLRAAQQSQGVALALGRFVRDELASGSLLRPMGERVLPLGDTYWMVTSRRTSVSHATKTVMAWLREMAAEP